MPDDLIKCLTSREAEDLLHHCLEDGKVIPGKHFRDELAHERISIADAWTVLRSGHIYDAPEPHIKTGDWNYRIEGHEPGGKWIAIVFCFKARDTAFLITIFSIEVRRKRRS